MSGSRSDGDAALQASRKSEKDWLGEGFVGLRYASAAQRLGSLDGVNQGGR